MPGPPRRTVLVVEDDAAIRELLRLHLDLSGFTIVEADDGGKALDRARATGVRPRPARRHAAQRPTLSPLTALTEERIRPQR